MYILALGDEKCRLYCPTAPSETARVSIRESRRERGPLWPWNSYSISWTTITTRTKHNCDAGVPHKVLAKMLKSTSSFMDVKHLSATSGLSPERLEIKHGASLWSFLVPAVPMEGLAPCSIGQGAVRQPGLRASTVHLAECALDAEAYIFIADLSGSLEKLMQPKKTLESPAE